MLDVFRQSTAPVFNAHPGVKLAWLIGSQARGTARAASDFDFAVAGEFDLLALRADLEEVLGHEVDVMDLRQDPLPYLKAVTSHGLIVYQRDAETLGDWTVRAQSILDLDWPLYERQCRSYLEGAAEGRPHG